MVVGRQCGSVAAVATVGCTDECYGRYGFNTGDLTICSDVLNNYLRNNDVIPWDDLRYIFGEIMYGGHITDNWDRRVNTTYLLCLVKPELFDGMELAPGYQAKFDGTYEEYRLYTRQTPCA